MKLKGMVFLLKYYLKIFFKKLFISVFSSFGFLWLFVEMSVFFLGEDSSLINKVKDHGGIFFFVVGLLIAVVLTKPKSTFGYKLSNRDTQIEISIGNLFNKEGSLVIGTNTTFDTRISVDLISANSVQGQFTKIIYHGDESKLDKEIAYELINIEPEILAGNRRGKNKKYPIGATVKLNQQDRIYYLVAIANINEHGVASTTYDDFKCALARLWLFLEEKGLKESVVIPVIGSGFSRLPQKREVLIREIIRSFVAACSESTFCDKLTIVIHPDDMEKYSIDIEELERFLQYICKYTAFSDNVDKTGHQL